mgnify:CR=1 FL=1
MKTQKTILNTLVLSFMVTAVAPTIAMQPEQQDSLAAIVKDIYSHYPKTTIGIAAIATLCLYKLYKRITQKVSLFKGHQFNILDIKPNQLEARDVGICQHRVSGTTFRTFYNEGIETLETCQKDPQSQFVSIQKSGKELYVMRAPGTSENTIRSALSGADCSQEIVRILLDAMKQTPSETLFVFRQQ